MKTSILLAGASLAALTIGANSAQAASPTLVWGGGSTLAVKVYRDIFNCFVTKADGIFATTPATYPAGMTISYPTGENSACTSQAANNDIIMYEPTGSGGALTSWEAANPNPGGGTGFATTIGLGNTIAYLDNAITGGSSTPYPEIQFAASDAYLTGQDTSASAAVGGEKVFQLPTFVTPIVVAIGAPSGTNPNLALTVADVCKLFGAAQDKTSKGVTISELVVRSDSSGTSFIFSDWLAKNCTAYNLGFTSANGFPSTKPNWTAVWAANHNHIATTSASGSGGVAGVIASTANALGYVSPDFTYPVVGTSTAFPSSVAGILPTTTATKTRITKTTYPSSYNVSTIGQVINDQLVAPGGSGYPIVGYTFIDTYSCYSTTLAGGLIGGPAQGKQLYDLLYQRIYEGGTQLANILNAQGFVPPAPALTTLLKSSGGPFSSTGIQHAGCPAK